MIKGRKKNRKRSFYEFMSWLEGVEAMQGPEWTPTEIQWKAIREMLDFVVPDEVEVYVNNTVPTNQPEQPQYIPQQQHTNLPIPPSIFDTEIPKRPVPSGLNRPPPKVRTSKKDEVIDTSNGHYETEFL